MLNINLTLFKCHWGDEIGITETISYDETYNKSYVAYDLMWEGKLSCIMYNPKDNSFRVHSQTYSIDYLETEYIISQIKRGNEEAISLLNELNRLINLPIEEKYKIIGDNLSMLFGEGICND